MNNGLLTKFHQSHAGESDYEEELEMLQYDMLYGKQEVYGGVVPYQPKEITMGIEPVSITDVSDVGGSIYVLGKNFTESSVVCVGDKRQETVFLNENTLMVPDKQLEGGDTIKVAQMTEIHEILSETEPYYCK
jgi:hypothetical protein